MVERRYSKGLAVANHVIFTANEVMQAPYVLQGQLFDEATLGTLRIRGREVQCIGFRLDVQVPARASHVQFGVTLYTGDGTAVGERLVVSGQSTGEEKIFALPVAMPSGSIWQAKVDLVAGETVELPEGCTLTYLLRYANGPSFSDTWSNHLPGSGVGYWGLGQDFVIV